MENEKLKSCPFCGSNETGLFRPSEYQTGANNRDWYIQCFGCNIETVEYLTMDEAIAAWNTRAPAELAGWWDIETAPKDGTEILAWCPEYGMRQTRMGLYNLGSPGYAMWERGDGPRTHGWVWIEEKHISAHSWNPTHWQPLPAPPGTTRAPADLRSALEAETIERACAAWNLLDHELGHCLLHSDATPYPEHIEMRAAIDALAALAPTKGDVS